MNTTNNADDLEDRLPGLLADAAADPPSNPRRLRQVRVRASRRRRNRTVTAAGSLAVVALGAAMTPALVGHSHQATRAPSLGGPATATTTATATATPTPTSQSTAGGHGAALFSVPNTTLSTSLAITYGTGAGTEQVTIPDGSKIGVVELVCEGQGGIGVDDHGALGAGALPVAALPTPCGPSFGGEGDTVVEGVRSGPNGVVPPGTPVTLTIKTTGNVRWWLVVGAVGGQSRSGIPNPDQIMIEPSLPPEALAGRTTAAGFLYVCGERKERVRVAFTLSGTPIDTVVSCAPREVHVLTLASPIHLSGPVEHSSIHVVGSQSPPRDSATYLLTPSGLSAWSSIPGVIHGTLTP